MVPVLVYVAADPLPPMRHTMGSSPRPDSSMLPNVAVIAQAVAEQIRSMLGERGDTLPSGVPVLTWRSLDAPIVVSTWRDGRLSSRLEGDSGDTSGSALLMRALVAARAAGVGVIWSNSPVDSLVFNLSLVAPSVTRAHSVMAQLDPIQVPAFTLAIPWQEEIKLQDQVPPAYPRDARGKGAQATIHFRYVVDTLGRVEPRSIRDTEDLARIPPIRQLRDFYPDFVQAVRAALVQWRFLPARLGGCRVAQPVAQTFIFGNARAGDVPWRFETP